MRRDTRLKDELGQVLILVVLMLPVFFAVVAVATDGSTLLTQRRSIQNAADAAALAAAQDVAGATACGTDVTCLLTLRARVVHDLEAYMQKNGGPDHLDGGSGPDPAQCFKATDTNCYTWPYKGSYEQVEVRLRKSVHTFFTGAISMGHTFAVGARSVANTDPVVQTTTTTIPGVTDPGHTIPGATISNTSTSVSTVTTTVPSGVRAVAFTKSTDCNGDSTALPAGASIQWTGATSSLKGLMSNGGISVSGNAGKTSDHIKLGRYNESACRDFYGSSTPNSTEFPDVGLLANAPVPWPVTPPTPAPPAGCSSTTGNTTGTNIISSAIWKLTHPPGVYCWTSGQLTIGANGVSIIGYTFYAPSITVSSNGMTFQNASGTDPPTVFDAYGADASGCSANKLSSCAFSINGQNNTITGDIFAPNGTIVLAGGGAGTANGGNGFLESIKLLVSGNYANFNGTGPDLGGTTTTTTTTSTSTTSTVLPPVVVPGNTVPGSTITNSTTLGRTIGLGE